MRLNRRILGNRWAQSLLCTLITGYIRLVFYTNRWTIKGEEILSRYNNPVSSNAIFAFWHGRLLVMPMFKPKNRTTHVMISVHNDGELIARAIESFDLKLIRGSSRKGGVEALIKAKKMLNQGDNVTITPDGPKGPRMHVNSNIVSLAKMTGAPIVPATFSTSRAKILKSWDRFLLAFPLGRGIIICGNPIAVDANCSDETMKTLTLQLETELNRITMEADRWAGVGPVTPA